MEKLIRDQMNNIILYGKHTVYAAIDNPSRECFELFVNKNNIDEVNNLLSIKKRKLKTHIVDNKYLDKLTNSLSHQGIALLCKTIFQNNLNNLELSKETSSIIILDQITDHNNIGAIIRSATAFGSDAIILQKKNAPDESGALAKVAVGTLEKMNLIQVVNIKDTIEFLKKHHYWVIALNPHATQEISGFQFPKKCIFVFGSEGQGLRRLVEESCDFNIKITMESSTESLNVSCSAAIVLREYYMQTHPK